MMPNWLIEGSAFHYLDSYLNTISACLSVCLSISSELRSLRRDLNSSFYQLPKTVLFTRAWGGLGAPLSSCLEVIHVYHPLSIVYLSWYTVCPFRISTETSRIFTS